MTAVPALSVVPTMRDEIDRKAFEQLERLAGQLESGRINEAQFDCGVQTVWQCVSGIASEWVIQTISEVKDMKRDAHHKDRRLFVKQNGPHFETLILSRDLGGDQMKLRSIPPGHHRDWDFKDCANPSREALSMQNKVADAFKGKGFRQI